MSEWEEKLGAILNNPTAMGKIMDLAQSLEGGETAENPGETRDTGVLEGLDPRLLEVGMGALSAYRGENKKADLLLALKPHIREEKLGKIDKMIEITKLSRAIRVVIDGLKGGNNADV